MIALQSTTPPPGREIPALTTADKERIRQIALSDPMLKEILAGKQYDVGDAYVWHTSHLQLLGGGLLVTFAHPFTREGVWPQLAYDRSEMSWRPFQSLLVHFRAESVSKVSVEVELLAGSVVEIYPDYGQVTNYTPSSGYTPYPTPLTPYPD